MASQDLGSQRCLGTSLAARPPSRMAISLPTEPVLQLMVDQLFYLEGRKSGNFLLSLTAEQG